MTMAISVDGLSKRFRIPLDKSATLKHRVTHWRSAARYRDFYALKDVSFDVPDGQFLGITGPNGCGKSTLLKILTRIYQPDSGSVEVNGEVSAFLELGVGFNPELTARENIFLGGAVLGLSRRQLADRVDAILHFADLEEFAELKLKNYSSGMQVRLAFTVAILAKADVLIMDEVLAVGDASFQQKCFDVFSRHKRQGRTIVLVSHDLGTLENYCDRVLLMQHGHIIADGPAAEVTALYRRQTGEEAEAAERGEGAVFTPVGNRWGSRELEIVNVGDIVCSVGIRRSDGLIVAGPNTQKDAQRFRCPPAGTSASIYYAMDSLPLLAGGYVVAAALYDQHLQHAYDHIEDVETFHMTDEHGRVGLIDPRGTWRMELNDEAAQPKAASSGAG
jgi:ABC-type polysaccharide/polyol phosphate transport system ATPase subunit